MRAHTLRDTILTSILALAPLATGAFAAPQSFTLSFASLPSAQGMTYTASGIHASTLEANIFSVNGGVLELDALAEPYMLQGGSAYYTALEGLVTTTESKRIRASARCLEVVGAADYADGRGGLAFGFSAGSAIYGFSISPSKLFYIGPVGWVPAPGTYDNASRFHDYRMEFEPPSTQRLYRDDVLVLTTTSSLAVTGNRIFLGDATGGSNARGEVRSFYFEQVTTLDAPAAPAAGLALRGPASNPAPRSHLDVAFTLASAERAELALLDVCGRRVAAMPVGDLGAGAHVVRLDPGTSLASGVYWLSLDQAGERRTRKVVLAD